jgi:hypothetical protein
MASMFSYTQAAMERAMKVQEVILRAMAKKITWWQAAEIIGISDRHMRRWRERYAGSAFVLRRSRDLDLIFALQFERTVNRDNAVSFQNLSLQIEALRWRSTLVGCMVIVHQHLDGSISLTHGPHRLGRYKAQGTALKENKMRRGRAVEKPQKTRDSHFPTAPTAAGLLTQSGQVTC